MKLPTISTAAVTLHQFCSNDGNPVITEKPSAPPFLANVSGVTPVVECSSEVAFLKSGEESHVNPLKVTGNTSLTSGSLRQSKKGVFNSTVGRS